MKLIVGIDPGTTTGLAILDINGNILAVVSKREMGRNEIVNFITKFGQPLIVASDVNPLPKTVEKIARILHVKPYFPEESLHIREKEELIKDFSGIVKDGHEVDALAASIKAWKSYRSFFLRTREELEKMGMSEFFEDVIWKLIRGEADNIKDAATEILNQKRRVLSGIKPTEEKDRVLIQKLQRALTQKDKYIEILRHQSTILSKALNKMSGELKDFEKIKLNVDELVKMRKDMGVLKKSNEFLKKLREIENRNFIPAIDVEDIIIDDLNGLIDLKDRFLFTNSLENLISLNQYEIKGLLTTVEPDKKMLKDLEFPVIKVKKEQIQNIGEIKVIKVEDLEGESKKAKKVGLIEWLEKYKKRRI